MKNYFDHIEDFINGELNHQEQSEFLDAMNNNPELFKSVQDYRNMVDQFERIRLKKKVSGVVKRKQDPWNIIWPVLSIAAMFLIIILAYSRYWPFQNHSPIQSEKENQVLFAEKFDSMDRQLAQSEETEKPLDKVTETAIDRDVLQKFSRAAAGYFLTIGLNSFRNIEDTAQSSFYWLDSARISFELKNYRQAISYAVKSDKSSQDESIKFFKGECYFFMKDYEKASKIFEELVGNFQYRYDAEWNLLICQLAEQRNNSWKNNLSRILKDKSHPYREKARELNNTLQSLGLSK